MPEIEFTINTETGECQTEIKGINGPACEKTAEQLRQLLGTPAVDQKTPEYHIKPNVKLQIKSK